MNNNILNEINRNRTLMGLNESEIEEQGFIDAVKKGVQKGKEFIKNRIKKDDNDSEEVIDNTQEPIKIEEHKQTTIKTYGDYITVEATTPSSDREIAQKLITATAEEKGLGSQTDRKVISLGDKGYRIIAKFEKI